MNSETFLTDDLLSYREALIADYQKTFPQYDFYFEDYLIERLYEADVAAIRERK